MPTIAVAIPCRNEEPTIRDVIEAFRLSLPEASIHVLDNGSSDATAAIARQCGARVHPVPSPGKGETVRVMFREIDADVLIMVDGDLTYPPDRARDLIAPIVNGRAEMVVATRLAQHESASFRPGHRLGNQLVIRAINALFGAGLTDALSGYRAFSRRFVKTMPVLSHGFEIETEITLHALNHCIPIVEVPVAYGARPKGSESKLHTLRDGARVLTTILRLFKDYRPMQFFGLIGAALIAASVVAGVVVVREFIELGHVAGVARAVLAVSAGLVGIVALATGLILETMNRRAREFYVLLADQIIAPSSSRGDSSGPPT